MRAEDIHAAIMTVARSPEYVHTTLASLFAADPLAHRLAAVDLVVGSDDDSYLACYRRSGRLRIRPMPAEDARRCRRWGVHRKFCVNYHRCLTTQIGEAKGLLLCEDDVIFRDGFVAKLLRTVEEMEDEHGLVKYLLACYVPHRLSDDPTLRRGRYFASYFAPHFYGTQCVYYPRCVLPEVSAMVYDRGVARPEEPGDMIVKEYAVAIEGLYGTVCSLAQHIGSKSTGLGRFHCSPTFEEEFPVLTPARSAKRRRPAPDQASPESDKRPKAKHFPPNRGGP